MTKKEFLKKDYGYIATITRGEFSDDRYGISPEIIREKFGEDWEDWNISDLYDILLKHRPEYLI